MVAINAKDPLKKSMTNSKTRAIVTALTITSFKFVMEGNTVGHPLDSTMVLDQISIYRSLHPTYLQFPLIVAWTRSACPLIRRGKERRGEEKKRRKGKNGNEKSPNNSRSR